LDLLSHTLLVRHFRHRCLTWWPSRGRTSGFHLFQRFAGNFVAEDWRPDRSRSRSVKLGKNRFREPSTSMFKECVAHSARGELGCASVPCRLACMRRLHSRLHTTGNGQPVLAQCHPGRCIAALGGSIGVETVELRCAAPQLDS
jgi:hypothetical protein